MHYTLIFLITIVSLVAIYFAHPVHDIRRKQKQNVNSAGIIEHLDEITDIKGTSGMGKGSQVTISLYADKITINNDFTIPLEKLKNVNTFNVKQITLTHNKKIVWNRKKSSWLKRLSVVFGYFTGLSIGGTKTLVNTFLTIEFSNESGDTAKGLFLITNDQGVKKFVETVNNQIGTVANGHVLI